MDSLIFKEADASEINNIASATCEHLKQFPILVLKGDLGAGKTTLTQSILKHLGYKDAVNSPTFNIVNVYKINSSKSVYHFDLYRIKHPEELDELGFIEYIDSGNICVIEWPELALNYIDTDYLVMNIQHLENKRSYNLNLIKVKQ